VVLVCVHDRKAEYRNLIVNRPDPAMRADVAEEDILALDMLRRAMADRRATGSYYPQYGFFYFVARVSSASTPGKKRHWILSYIEQYYNILSFR
jgi:hypothetical protein